MIRLDSNVQLCIDDVLASMYQAFPELMEKYGERGLAKCREDNVHHFRHLETAYLLNNNQIMIDYAVWLDGILRKFGMTTEHLVDNFERIREAAPRYFEDDRSMHYVCSLQSAIDQLKVREATVAAADKS